jgi:diguanylate cyclase (GGDEF)-like protein
MALTRPPDDLSLLARTIARADDYSAAFDTVAGEVSRLLNARVCIFEHLDRGWMLMGQARGGLRVPVSDLRSALDAVPLDAPIAAIDLRALGEGVWTSVSLDDERGAALTMLVSGDWTGHSRVLTPSANALAFALASVRERQARRHAEGLLVDGYTMARRLSRLGGVEAVCQRVVDQVSRSIGAERVALALYRPDEDRLAVAATHGYPVSMVRDVRIEPGSWVIGHVFSSGRSVLVPDIRQTLALSSRRQQYRSFSFAAVPVFAGREAVGVLSATDKTDGSAFTREDIVALRTISVSAALALIAARSDTEVHRLAYAATVDAHTGLFNRPYFETRLHQEVERAKRASSSLALLMADVDDFKRINDSYGHPVGDTVLHAVGGLLRSAVRVFDVCARYGGDEFAILMPSSDHASALACAERIRHRVAEYEIRDDRHPALRLTMSIGVAVIEPEDSPSDLTRRADQFLYQAKSEGKNLVRMAGVTAARQPPLLADGADETA